jgi:hypothetical protein
MSNESRNAARQGHLARQVGVREWTAVWWAGRVVPDGLEGHLYREVARLGGHRLDQLRVTDV